MTLQILLAAPAFVYEECRIAGGLVEIEAEVSRLFKGGGDHNIQRPAQFSFTAGGSDYFGEAPDNRGVV